MLAATSGQQTSGQEEYRQRGAWEEVQEKSKQADVRRWAWGTGGGEA